MTSRTHLFPELASQRFTLWVSHDKVRQGAWTVLLSGLTQRLATDEMLTRQDRVRRNGSPCRFKLLPDGETP